MNARGFIRLGLSVAVMGLMVACSSSSTGGSDRASSTAESMATLSQRLDKAKAQVDTILGSLDGVVVASKGGDIKEAFKKFASDVDATDSAAEAARGRYASMKAKAEEHFKAWEAESQKITDPALQQAAAKRRDVAQVAFGKVVETSGKVKADYEPFISNLKDIKAYLGADLTPQAVELLEPNIKKAKSLGESLKKSIQGLQDAMASVRSELTAAKAAAPAPAK
jgi:hypothetical protein